jgi:hypothetical protein
MAHYKICTCCRQSLPATTEYFKRHKACSDGLYTRCKTCESRLRKKKYQENLEEAREEAREKYKKNRQAILSRMKVRRESDPEYHQRVLEVKRESYHRYGEKNREKKRNYIACHREQEKERAKEWYWNNRERSLQYHRDHPESVQSWRKKNHIHVLQYSRSYKETHQASVSADAKRQNFKRRERIASNEISWNGKDWKICLDYFDHRCAVCGRPSGLFHVLAADHWIPLSKGGETTRFNIIPLCHGIDGCNNKKHHKSSDAWLIESFGKRKANAIMKKIRDYFDFIKESDCIGINKSL